MTDLTTLQMLTLEQVCKRPKGDEIRGKDIAKLIGLKPRNTGKEGADMRSIIHALRIKGYPICANGKGYYWAADDTELMAYLKGFEARINDQRAAMQGMVQKKSYTPMEIVEI